jgi:hypothetical protein
MISIDRLLISIVISFERWRSHLLISEMETYRQFSGTREAPKSIGKRGLLISFGGMMSKVLMLPNDCLISLDVNVNTGLIHGYQSRVCG